MSEPELRPGERVLRDLLYVRREPESVPEDALSALAAEWLSALRTFGADALDAGFPPSVVMPAVVQMLEGWMLAHDPSSLATSWAALDATVTLLHIRLQDVSGERDELAREVGQLREQLAAGRPGKARAPRGRKGKRRAPRAEAHDDDGGQGPGSQHGV